MKTILKDFEHDIASMWNEHNCTAVGTFFGVALLWDWKQNWFFQSCSHWWVFQVCWHIECSSLTASSFRIWKRSNGIPSPTLALFLVILPKANWVCTPRCLALGEWSHHHGYLGQKGLFVYFFMYSCHLFPPSLRILFIDNPKRKKMIDNFLW